MSSVTETSKFERRLSTPRLTTAPVPVSKGQRSKPSGRLTPWPKISHSLGTGRPTTSTWYTDGVRWPASKVKVITWRRQFDACLPIARKRKVADRTTGRTSCLIGSDSVFEDECHVRIESKVRSSCDHTTRCKCNQWRGALSISASRWNTTSDQRVFDPSLVFPSVVCILMDSDSAGGPASVDPRPISVSQPIRQPRPAMNIWPELQLRLCAWQSVMSWWESTHAVTPAQLVNNVEVST